MTRLDGRVALVTGSSRGIGAEIARLFASEGAAVAVHGRDAAMVEDVRSKIEADGGRAAGVVGDVLDEEVLPNLRAQITDSLGVVDVLVTCAGGNFTAPAPLEEIPLEGWRATVEGNLTATFLTIKAFLPGMKELGRGEIITISSTAGRAAAARVPIAYAAAKAGIQLMTQDVALQAGPHGIRANCIAPETILTERNRQQIPPELQSQMAATHVTGRLGTPSDVAQAALFLADREASGWITGTILDVAGGTTT